MPEKSFAAELAANQANWDARAVVHAKSPFYDVDRFIDDPNLISAVVEWDRRSLGDVKGLDILHLQCHIGTDSLSWARLGANVTGLDFSHESLRAAKDMCRRAGAKLEFVHGDVRRAHHLLRRQFDVVYTSVGVLCWLPDIYEWAEAVAACVRPGGRFYIRDGHPIKNTFDYERDDSFVVCKSNYFTDGQPEQFRDEYTYTGDRISPGSAVAYEWTHGLGTIITALVEHGLQVKRVEEFDWLDWQLFPWMIQGQDGHWRFPPGHPRLPLSFAILADRLER